ncbi:MAG TPA: 3D domain-containing protein, partial [Chthoniobacteraceae bacterium]|nr:3D domain-containing protein [Chthoniobacteraceae bacterium]
MRFVVLTVEEFADWLERARVTRPITRIQNHHTWSPDYSCFNGSNHVALLKGMRDFHVNENGWADIGQHITTFPDGTVSICRPFNKVPACIKGANSGAICIESLGNFDRHRDQMTDAQRRCVILINALLCEKFELPIDSHRVVYHHWFELDRGVRNNGTGNNKSCPGTAFFGGNKVADCERHFLPLVREARGLPRDETSVDARLVAPLGEGWVKPTADGFLCVRAEPNVRAREVDRLFAGTRVEYYGRKGGWVLIHLVEQRWVSARFLGSPPTTGDGFDLPPPDGSEIDAGRLLWGTYYYGQPAAETSRGVVLQNGKGEAVGPCVSQRNWCLGAMEGTLIVTHADGSVKTYNYECTGRSQVTSCRAVFPSLSAGEVAATEKVCWKPARGPYGDGAGRFILAPYRTLAVDRSKIPLGTAIYIPSARGVPIVLPDGSSARHDGYFFAADVGGKIRGTHVDFFLGSSTRN